MIRCFCSVTDCAEELCPRYKHYPDCYRQHNHYMYGRGYFYDWVPCDITKARVADLLKKDLLCQYDIDDLKEKGLI